MGETEYSELSCFDINLIYILNVARERFCDILDIKLLWLFIFLGFIISLAYEAYGASIYVANRLDLAAKRNIEINVIKVVKELL